MSGADLKLNLEELHALYADLVNVSCAFSEIDCSLTPPVSTAVTHLLGPSFSPASTRS